MTLAARGKSPAALPLGAAPHYQMGLRPKPPAALAGTPLPRAAPPSRAVRGLGDDSRRPPS